MNPSPNNISSTNISCAFEKGASNGLSVFLAVILFLLAMSLLLSDAVLMYLTWTSSLSWLKKFNYFNWTISNLVICGMLVSGGVQTAFYNSGFLQPSVCLSVLSLQLFALAQFYLLGFFSSVLFLVSTSNPLRAETKLFKMAVVTVIVGVWIFCGTIFLLGTAYLYPRTESALKLCEQNICWRFYPKEFIQIIVHGLINGSVIGGVITLALLMHIARKHARQIDSLQDSLRINRLSETVFIRSRVNKVNMCLLKTVPFIITYNIAPVIVIIIVYCPVCLPVPWDTFILCAPFGAAVFIDCLKSAGGKELSGEFKKLRERCSRRGQRST